MLSREENELITRVGPGTPMGNAMRRYWIPALLSRELPSPTARPRVSTFSARTWSPSATPKAASG